MTNKIKYGLRNVHYAVITEGSPNTFGAPAAIRGGVSLSLSPLGERVDFYADDAAYYSGESNLGYEGTLEVALLPDSFKRDVLGYLEDANGALVEDSAAQYEKIALMFEFQGDANATRHVLYNVSVGRPSIESSTKGENLEPQTDSIEIVAAPATDTGYVKGKLAAGSTGYDTFYDAVYTFNAPNNEVSPTSETFDLNTGSADYENKVFTVTSSGENSIKDVLVDGVAVGGTNYTIAGLGLTITKEYLETLAVGAHTLRIELAVGVAVTVALDVVDTTA